MIIVIIMIMIIIVITTITIIVSVIMIMIRARKTVSGQLAHWLSHVVCLKSYIYNIYAYACALPL